MSNLSNLEKRKFEKLLGMSSGYVLDFSNRTFTEFITDSTGLNIYDARYDYGSGSKANRLRKFWQVEKDGVVAKLMEDILDSAFPVGVRKSASDTALEGECRQILARLSKNGRVAAPPDHSSQHPQQASQQQISLTLAQLKEQFCQLTAATDRNKAGLALEGLLNRLFALFGLQPRRS